MKLIKPIQVNEYQDTKADKIIMRVFIFGLIGILLFLSILIFYSNSVSAASVTQANLPITIPAVAPYNSCFSGSQWSQLANKIRTDKQLSSSDSVLIAPVATNSDFSNSIIYVSFVVLVNPSCTQVFAPDFNYLTSQVFLTNDFYCFYTVRDLNGTLSYGSSNPQKNYGLMNICGSATTKEVNNTPNNWVGNYTRLYPIYYDGADITSTDTTGRTIVVLSKEAVPTINSGHASNPGTPQLSGTHPSAPTNNTYTWTTPSTPSIDDSTIITLVKSFINVFVSYIVWLAENLEGFFSNLFSNLWAWLQYIASLLNYWFDNVWSIIKDFMLNFFNNMESLFAPLGQNVASIVEKIVGVFDFLNPDEDDDLPTLVSDIISAIENFSLSDIQDYLEDFYDDYLSPWFDSWSRVISFFVGLYGLGLNNNNEFSIAVFLSRLIIPDHAQFVNMVVSHDNFHMISSVSHVIDEMSNFYVSLADYENYKVKFLIVPSCTFFGVTIPATSIDFSWFDDYKFYSDTIISAFLIIGYFYWLFTRFSGILNHTSAPNIK